MKRSQQNIRTSRFAEDSIDPKQPAFSIPKGSTSGQHGPKYSSTKYRQNSRQARLSDSLRSDDAPTHEDNATNTSNKNTARDGTRFNKSKLRAEKSGAKLNAMREKLTAQKALKKPGPVKTVVRAARFQVLQNVHGKIHEVEHENAGVEAAHRTELAGEKAVRGTMRFVKQSIRTHPTHRIAKLEKRDIKARADFQFRKVVQEHPELKKNAFSRFLQKQRIKKRFQKQAREAAKKGAKAAEKTAVTTGKITRAAVGFVIRHPVGVLIALAALLLIITLHSCMASLTTVGNGLTGAVAASTYPPQDANMLAAEAAYSGMEADLQNELDNYETQHPGYDEYRYDLDAIWHDPYVLISILSAMHEGAWTLDDVQDSLSMLFERQYILIETVDVEVRYRTETTTWTDADGQTHTGTYEVPYNYYICTVTMENFNLSHLPIYIMSEDQLSRFALFTATHGNRPDLFPQSLYPNASVLKDYTDYDITEEYLSDETFAAMITEAERYLGYPYVWGGYCPATSFDCSGFVSWVINHSGWDVGRLGAQALCSICTPVSAANAKPGDLVFFVGTYDTPGVSHVGIYVGDGMMLHCGDPIGYTSIETSYWQSHLYAFGRLP